MASRLALKANPTFPLEVGIPVAGGKTEKATFVAKHRTKTGLEEFIADRPNKTDLETVMAMVEGWDLEHEFNEENVTTILEEYGGAAVAIFRAYIDELTGARRKN